MIGATKRVVMRAVTRAVMRDVTRAVKRILVRFWTRTVTLYGRPCHMQTLTLTLTPTRMPQRH